mgnify:FL=1
MKSKSLYHDNLAMSLDYDSGLKVWLVSVSLAVADDGGKATPAEVAEIVLEEVESLVKSLVS